MSLVVLVTLALASVNEADAGEPLPEAAEQVAEPTAQADAGAPLEQVAAAPNPEVWAGEERRVHFGVGALVHAGLMDSGGFPLWVLQSELIGIASIRLSGHNELRVQLGVAVGYPDSAGGETNVSFNHALTPRLSVGIGGFAYLSIWSLRVGVEAPLVIRIGSSRRHNVIIGLRLQLGVFNNVSISAWTLAQQRLAFAGDLAVGYAFLF